VGREKKGKKGKSGNLLTWKRGGTGGGWGTGLCLLEELTLLPNWGQRGRGGNLKQSRGGTDGKKIIGKTKEEE